MPRLAALLPCRVAAAAAADTNFPMAHLSAAVGTPGARAAQAALRARGALVRVHRLPGISSGAARADVKRAAARLS